MDHPTPTLMWWRQRNEECKAGDFIKFEPGLDLQNSAFKK